MGAKLIVMRQLLIKYFVCDKYRRKWECNGSVHFIFIDFWKVCDRIRREIL